MIENIIVNEERVVLLIKSSLKAREKKEGIFAEGPQAPEVPFMKLIRRQGEVMGIDAYPLHATFFIGSTLYADNTARQMRLITRGLSQPGYGWLFRPELVVKRSSEQVVAAARQLIRPGYNGAALERWHSNAALIVERYGGDLRNFFEENQNYAPDILNALVGPQRKKDWPLFHRYGPKLGRLFLHWVSKYSLAEVSGIEEIGIPVDWQVARLVIQTGGITLNSPAHKHLVLDQTLVPLMTKLCKENSLSPLDVSETLWLLGNRGCNNFQHQGCPLEAICDRLISRKPLDERGLFDPKDVGRWRTPLTNRQLIV